MSDSNSTTTTNELDRAWVSVDSTPSTVANCSASGCTSSASTRSASSTNQVPDTTDTGVLMGGNPSRSSPNPNADIPAISTTPSSATVTFHWRVANAAIEVMTERRCGVEDGASMRGSPFGGARPQPLDDGRWGDGGG